VKLRTGAPAAPASSCARPVAELRTTLGAGGVGAEAELLAIEGVPRSGVGVADRILRRLAALLDGRMPEREADTPEELLGRDLLGLPQIEFDLNWRRMRPLPTNLMPELLGSCDAAVDPLAAGRARISRLDLVGEEPALGHDRDDTGAAGPGSESRNDAGDAKDTAPRTWRRRGLWHFGERKPSDREE
jgi:hypothetical protein